MTDYLKQLGFTDKQIETLFSYKMNSKDLLFDNIYNQYQLEYLLSTGMTHEQIMEYLEGLANSKNVIDEYKFLYKTPEYKEVREASDKEVFLLQDELKSENGKPCQYCKSTQTIGVFVQTRSADEPMSYIVTCLACKRRQK